MAAKTKFSDDRLTKIVSEYDIGEFIKSKPFKAGYAQTNILIVTRKGKYVLRCYEDKSRECVLFEADVLRYLGEHNYPCAMPIKDKNQNVIKLHDKKPFIIFSYLDGRHLKNINHKQLTLMVKHLALLHNITKGYKPINYKCRAPRSIKFCLSLAKKASNIPEDSEERKRRFEIVKNRLRLLKLPITLPMGFVHGDFDKANIKFIKDRLTGVLDFDDSTYTFLIYDLGVILLYWTRFYLKSFDFKKAKNIISIYEKFRPLSNIEKRHIYDALQLHALMMMSWLIRDDRKKRDLFMMLNRILDELDHIGREDFYKKIFD